MNGSHLDKSSHSEIWVIGNGESRKTFDLHSIDTHIIGCNAIHREFICDQIVAVDRRMVTEIVANPDYINVPVYTRPNWIGDFTQFPNVRLLPELPYKGPERRDEPWHWNTGPFAIVIACYMNPKTINLLGFDLYSVNNTIKNYESDMDSSYERIYDDVSNDDDEWKEKRLEGYFELYYKENTNILKSQYGIISYEQFKTEFFDNFKNDNKINEEIYDEYVNVNVAAYDSECQELINDITKYISFETYGDNRVDVNIGYFILF